MESLVHWNQLLAHALSFVVFFFLVRLAFMSIIYPPMRERRDQIKAEHDRIQQAKADAEELKGRYEAHLKKVEAESRERIQQAVAEGQRVAGEIREIARKEAQENLTRAREEIALERDKAQAEIKNQVVDLAMDIARKVVQEELSPARHKKLVDEFLAEVGEAR
ncbi:MAG TPA: F0F1 ATP synthase subunit B [Candidatus Eisenbacteria bacterium]|nr:F0F1 ATP synthase subunit B [Candidatus Eisenbacteria bacterium]